MPEVVDILVVSEGAAPQVKREKQIAAALEEFNPQFRYVKYKGKMSPISDPNLVVFYIDALTTDYNKDILRLAEMNPSVPKIALVEYESSDFKTVAPFVELGLDEVMTTAQLETGLGQRLIHRVVASHLKKYNAEDTQKSEERFRGIIEHASDIVTLLEADGTILYQSPSFQRLLGYSPWEVLGKDAFEFIHPEDVDRVHEITTKIITGELAISPPTEFRFRHRDGSWRVLSSIGTNQLDNDAVQAVVVNSRDITEEKKAEEELEQYRLHLEELVEQRTREVEQVTRKAAAVLAASPDALMAIDNDKRIIFVSEHWRNTYRKNAGKLLGMHIEEAFRILAEESNVPPDDPRYEEMRAWWADPKGQKEFRTNNGVWLRNQAAPMLDGSGTAVSTTNITEYKEQERRLEAALEKERQVTEQQRRFVTMVSHEFRTPLTIIDGNAQIVQRRGTTLSEEDMKKRSGTIRDAVKRLVEMIETLLAADRMEEGTLSIHPEPCDLAEILRKVCHEQQDVDRSHVFHLDLESLPKRISVDPKLIFQVFTNIVSNAIKYSPKSPDIHVKGWVDDASVYVSIEDQGVGIPENEQKNIFRRFFRASTSTGIPGSGIGLNITRELLRMHGGDIHIESAVGQGTTVTVKLPLKGAGAVH